MLLLCPLPLPVVSVHRDSTLDVLFLRRWKLCAGRKGIKGMKRTHSLPPRASPALQPSFSHQSAAKVELSHKTNQWQKGKLLGSGTFDNVYEATNRHTGALCAMKEVNIIPDDPKLAECLKQLEQEIKFLSQFKHSNIVQYYGMETIEDHLYICLEHCGRNLKHAEKKLSIEFGDP
ncbi:hypothetical protein ZIOFF_019115 [Zingiber officinale]|uniref:Protein kinase domain-containing protein n=1 Tax=Zingiber officinale TaxID=94328 RepID=A0A8J5HDS6_ZINOF|nr:hypothetical protein ZIOFF_019115 [Zingiber officinale]